jgi:hypothetical protein
MKSTLSTLICCLLSPVLLGQAPAGQNVSTIQYLQASYTGLARQLLTAAERMPAADYSFKPSQMAEARTYGAVIAHATDGMFGACARARGLSNPQPDVETTLRQKADIITALTRSIEFCAEAFSGLTDSNAADPVRQGPVDVPRMAALIGLLAHNAEMFGISTVYLRARNIVPPGSEGRQ